jgi:hypothetical protein
MPGTFRVDQSILKAAFCIAVSPAAEAIVTKLGAPWSSCEPSPSQAAAFSVAVPQKKAAEPWKTYCGQWAVLYPGSILPKPDGGFNIRVS